MKLASNAIDRGHHFDVSKRIAMIEAIKNIIADIAVIISISNIHITFYIIIYNLSR
jgi:hypothetical protein